LDEEDVRGKDILWANSLKNDHIGDRRIWEDNSMADIQGKGREGGSISDFSLNLRDLLSAMFK
jgi:hypothetical protein